MLLSISYLINLKRHNFQYSEALTTPNTPLWLPQVKKSESMHLISVFSYSLIILYTVFNKIRFSILYTNSHYGCNDDAKIHPPPNPSLTYNTDKGMNYDREAISLWVLASKLEAGGRRVKVNVIS